MNSSPLQSNAYYIWFIGRIEEEEKRIDVNFYPKKTLGKCYLSRGVKTERASELRHMSLRQNAGEPSA